MGNTGDEPHPPSAPGASQPLSRGAAPTAPRLAFFARPRHTLRMLAQRTLTLTVATTGRKFHDLTGEIAALVKETGFGEGLTTLHLKHTSASLVIQENADPGVRRDLERFMARVCPDGDPMFEHDYEGPDDMPAHVRTALTSVTLSVPITGGSLALGTWQGIYLWEHRHAGHHRQVAVHLLGE